MIVLCFRSRRRFLSRSRPSFSIIGLSNEEINIMSKKRRIEREKEGKYSEEKIKINDYNYKY